MPTRATHDFGGTERFRIIRRLGAGGMGVVYEAEDRERRQRIAIKTLQRVDARTIYRFKNEFRALQDIEHPNLVRLGELIETEGQWFFTMELVHGTDLLDYVHLDQPESAPALLTVPMTPTARSRVGFDEEETGPSRLQTQRAPPYDEQRLRASMQQLAVGLSALHESRRIHRDVKPSNVRVTQEGRVVLLDFGLVTEQRQFRQSTEMNVVGTAAYMAPEQASASRSIGPAADWYSFGVVLYEALTASLPFAGSSVEILMDKQRLRPPPARARVPEVPEDLESLCMDLLQFDPAERPTGTDVLKRLGATTTTTAPSVTATNSGITDGSLFVGRERELAALHAADERARAGHATTAFVHGASGLGKTALVNRFIEELEADGDDVVILRGRCYERESVPYKGIDGVVDELSRALQRIDGREVAPLVPRMAALLPRVFPVLGRVEQIADAPRPRLEPQDPHEERRWVFSALHELLSLLAERHPLVIVVDDFQWTDADSVELLRAVLGRGDEPPPALLLVLTSREPEIPYGAEARWPVAVEHIEIGSLSGDESRALVTLLSERSDTELTNIDELAVEAGGHPLFIAELVRHLSAGGAGAQSASLDEAIWSRVSGLPADVRRALELIALANVPLALSALERASGATSEEVARQVATLRVAALARSAHIPGAPAVEPYHDRVREAVVGNLSTPAARERHAQLALALEREPYTDAETLAEHRLGAGDVQAALALFARAARRSEELLAFERAAALYRHILALSTPPERERSDLLTKLGHALASAGNSFEAAAAYQDAIAGANPAQQIDLRRLAATYLLRSGHVDEGLTALEEVLRSVDLRFPSTRLGAMLSFVWNRALLAIGGMSFREHDPTEIAQKELIRVDALRAACEGLGWVDGVRAADVTTRYVRAALATGEPSRVTRALAAEAVFVSFRGSPTEPKVNAMLDHIDELAARIGTPELEAYALGTRGLVAQNMARFEDNYHYTSRALEVFRTRCTGVHWEMVSVTMFRLFGMVFTMRLREFTEVSRDALLDADQRGDLWLGTLIRTLVSPYVLLRTDRIPEAREQLRRGLEPWKHRDFGFPHWNCLQAECFADMYEGKPEAAIARLRDNARNIARSKQLHVQLLRTNMSAALAKAHLLTYARDGDSGHLGVAERLASKLAREGTAFASATACVLRGSAAMMRGDDERARVELQRVLEMEAQLQTSLLSDPTRLVYGRLIGGEDGAAMSAAAHQNLLDLGIVDPERWSTLQVPHRL